MSLLRVAARRATPIVARSGQQQVRHASTGGLPHYDPFAIDPSNKRQNMLWWAGVVGALSAPAFAVRYQLNKYKYDKRSFG